MSPNNDPETLYVVARKLTSMGIKDLAQEVAKSSIQWLKEHDRNTDLLEALRRIADIAWSENDPGAALAHSIAFTALAGEERP